MNLPCYNIVLDIPGKGKTIGELEKKVWRRVMENSILGESRLFENVYYRGSVQDFLDLETVIFRYPLCGIHNEIFGFYANLDVVSVKSSEIEFSIKNSTSCAINMSREIKNSMFNNFWESVNQNSGYYGYCELLAPIEYSLISVDRKESNYSTWLKIYGYFREIPVWDYSGRIKEYLEPYKGCSIDEKINEIVQGIKESKSYKATIKFIMDKAAVEGRDKLDKDQVENAYEQLLYELIYVWAGQNGCFFG